MNRDLTKRPTPPPPAPQNTGLLNLAHLQFQVWLAEHSAEFELRRITSQQRLLAAQTELARAQLAAECDLAEAVHLGRQRILQAILDAEEIDAELRLRRAVRTASHAEACRLLEEQVALEKLYATRSQLRTQRFAGSAMGAGLPTLATGGVEVHLSDESIRSLALKAVTRFAQLPQAEQEAAWSAWQKEIAERFPPFATQEIVRLADELRAQAR